MKHVTNKKLFLIAIVLLLIPMTASAVTLFTDVESFPSYDRFRFEKFSVDLYPETYIKIEIQVGYDDGGFVIGRFAGSREIRISNRDINYAGTKLYIDDENGMMMDLPAAYQENPASKILQEVNQGTFGGQATLEAYLETIIKVIAGL